MANPNEEPLRARGRPATPETALRAALAQATLALLLDGGYAAATVDAVAKRAGVAKKPCIALPPIVMSWWRRR